MTDSSVLAGVGRAVINVDVTVCPCPPHGTATSVPIDQVLEETNTILHSLAYTHWSPGAAPIHASSCILSHMASGSVPAGVGSTLVCFCLAAITIVTSPSTVTHVAIDKILGKGGKRENRGGDKEEGAREEGTGKRGGGEGEKGRRGEGEKGEKGRGRRGEGLDMRQVRRFLHND